MTTDTYQKQQASLELALYLSLLGKFPTHPSEIDYTFLLKRLKKETGIVFNVNKIEQIIIFIYSQPFFSQAKSQEHLQFLMEPHKKKLNKKLKK